MADERKTLTLIRPFSQKRGSVTKNEQAYAFEKMSAIWQSRVKTIMSNGEVP